MAVDFLCKLISGEEQPEPVVALYLLANILNRFASTDSKTREQLVEVISSFLFLLNLITNCV